MTAPNQTLPPWFKRQFSYLRNWLGLAGAIITAASILAFALLLLIDANQPGNAYLGLLAYIVAPGFFLFGISTALLGWILERRKQRKLPHTSRTVSIDLSRPRDRRIIALFILGGGAFMLLTTMGSYQTYHLTETNQFCGAICHTQMQPQYERWSLSPHAKVDCVDCHVGSSAGSYLRAKAGGVRKVKGVLLDNYPTPITIKESSKTAAQEACMNCHSEDFSPGLELKTYQHFLSNDDNTPFALKLVLNLSKDDHTAPKGIHWHTAPGNEIEYIIRTNEFEETLAVWARLTKADGRIEEFRTEEFEEAPNSSEIRKMDCLTCHNRPAHQFAAPNDEIEKAIAHGSIDNTLPKIKQFAAEALSAEYANFPEAENGISIYLKNKYKDREIDSTLAFIQNLYRENFFPEMKADWRQYPDNTGHKDTLGCFRCHNEALKNVKTQKVVARDNCSLCHEVIAQGQGEQLAQIVWSGLEFDHPDGGYSSLTCADCHTGGIPAE